MNIIYSLTPELRAKLKEPFGMMIRGSFFETMSRLEVLIKEEKPPCVISVGDTVSRNLGKIQVLPKISIIDNLAMRKTIQPFSLIAEKTVRVRNPQATITDEAINAIQDSLKCDSSVNIIVDGEEDLLALIAVLYAPENAFVVYGQPYEGIVVVRATATKKEEVAAILKAMASVRKAK
jgi:uncharacterized protein (UPF0218 family)